MHFHSLKLALFAFASFAPNLAISASSKPVNPGACQLDKLCTVSGKLYVYRGVQASVAELKTSRTCFAAALPEKAYLRYQRKRGVLVRITGLVYSQETADGIVSYRLQDRDVATGVCSSGPVIYVTKIQFLN